MKKTFVIIILLVVATSVAIITGCSKKGPEGIAFAASYAEALQAAGESSQKMLVTFYTEW